MTKEVKNLIEKIEERLFSGSKVEIGIPTEKNEEVFVIDELSVSCINEPGDFREPLDYGSKSYTVRLKGDKLFLEKGECAKLFDYLKSKINESQVKDRREKTIRAISNW